MLFRSIADETSAGDGFAGGVLEAGEFEAGHLRPIVRNVLQILGVGGELAEEGPEAFDLAELFFGGGFLFAGASELVVADDAGDGVVTDGEIELLLETLGTEGGLLAEFDDHPFEGGGGLVGAAIGTAAQLGERGRFTRDIAAEPFADGVAGAAELAGGGLEAVLAGEGNELLMEPVAVGFHAIEFKVGAVHAGKMASFARRCCASSGGGAATPPCGACSSP